MIKQAFTTGTDLLIVTHDMSDGSITLNVGSPFTEPTRITLKTKEEFCAFVGELYRMWDKAQEVKSV